MSKRAGWQLPANGRPTRVTTWHARPHFGKTTGYHEIFLENLRGDASTLRANKEDSNARCQPIWGMAELLLKLGLCPPSGATAFENQISAKLPPHGRGNTIPRKPGEYRLQPPTGFSRGVHRDAYWTLSIYIYILNY